MESRNSISYFSELEIIVQGRIAALYSSGEALKGFLDYLFTTSKRADSSSDKLPSSIALPMLKGTP